MISLLKHMLIAVEKRSMRQSLTVCVAVMVLLLGLPMSVEAANRMYWADAQTSKIQRANLDGTNLEDVVITGPFPIGLDLDVAGGKIYWSEVGPNKIRRANFDGTGIEDLVGSVGPSAIALDVAGGKIYWADAFVASKIQRANLDGTGVEDLVTFGDDRAGIALDVAGGKMYWTVRTSTRQKIQRANLDGTAVEDLVTGLVDPRQIALDVAGGKMYWTDAQASKIQRANLDGSGLETLVTGLVNPHGMALDVAGGKMYWTDFGSDKIQRATLDGSGVEDLVTGLGNPVEIALELEVAIAVDIDIKPGKNRDKPNRLNPNSQGKIKVAILGTIDFDATQVDATTLAFGPDGAGVAHQQGHVVDIDKDGDADLVVRFKIKETGIKCGDTEATLTGATFGGEPIIGTDTVKTVGCVPAACISPPSGLVSWWPGDGNALDIVGPNDGTLFNGATFAPGLVGPGFSFDGVDDFVDTGGTNIDDLQQLTIDAWVKHNSLPSGKIERYVTLTGEKAVLRHDGENGPGQFHFFMNIDGVLRHVRVNNVLQAEVFHHVAGTYDGSVMRLYLDGVEVGSLAVLGTVGAGTAVELSSESEPLDGLIDEVEIYDRALSASEIAAIFTAGDAGKCKKNACRHSRDRGHHCRWRHR